ncbi:hypothetical protein B0F90DRAFT_1813906 [Multifurca ochricompacta]|uniref:Spermidine synthase n=1 Tax=Multifurca ochricompacta TaxID=376703 RepID=A0AAD4QSS0_9AGAM|nr:hypothetical protein B0F90DRAFT_1813906 [Multifurca ochricompacta]
MPPRPRKKRESAAPAPLQSRENQIANIPREEGHKSHIYILLIIPILLLIASLSLVTFLYLRDLDPLYGGVSINLHLDKIVWAATITGAFGPVPSLWPSLAILGGLVASIPVSSYWTALYTGRVNNPTLGSTVTHLVVLFPVIYLGVSVVKRSTAAFETYSSENSTARFTILPACATSIIGFQTIWGGLLGSYDLGYSDNEILRILGGTGIVLYAFSSTLITIYSSSKKLDKEDKSLSSLSTRGLLKPGLAVLFLSLSLWLMNPPLLPRPVTRPYTHPNFPLRILSSTSSVTGVIVVGESLPSDVQGTSERYPTSLRYLRASHSILGGVWIGDKIATRANSAPLLDAEGTPLGDSIYSAFVLQEAVRLINTSDRAIQPDREKALFIGLGAGVAVTSFARRNIDTSVIEIDPAVYDASRQYFGLPDLGSGRVFLQDARVVVAEKRRAALQYGASDADRYDYVVHDCFSGGGVPAHLFTTQFWEDLKTIMNPEGVVAVNFAGRINSDPAKAILFTLQRSFGQCRVLHDLPLDQPDLVDTFVNLVFFCSPSTKPLSFRSPSEADYAGSHLRAMIFGTLREREVDPKLIRGDTKDGNTWVLSDANNQLIAWQKDGALEHWSLMRKIFPESLWATY